MKAFLSRLFGHVHRWRAVDVQSQVLDSPALFTPSRRNTYTNVMLRCEDCGECDSRLFLGSWPLSVFNGHTPNGDDFLKCLESAPVQKGA